MDMQVSKRSRYALEALVYLAAFEGAEHESLKVIAEKLGTSWKYLEQIFMALKKAGVVESVRGPQGGYRLARDAREIGAGEVIRALEGPLAPVPCILEGKDRKPCALYEGCVTRTIWKRIMTDINKTADSISIFDLSDKCKIPGTVKKEDFSI